MKRNYDTIAWFYDWMARMVFGNALIDAQLFLLSAVPVGSSVLIVGGGTGLILEELAKLHPSGLTITNVDASEKMTAIARKRNTGKNDVSFIVSGIEDTSLKGQYDVVLTPFIFDNFTDDTLPQAFSVIHNLLRPAGLWLYCDFQNTRAFSQRMMLKVMYLFFQLSCGIAASRLPDAEGCFLKNNYKVLQKKSFLKDFVSAIVYQKM